MADPREVVHSDPEIMGGTPVFVGTRVPVQSLFDYLEAGDSVEEFLEAFPTVSREQVLTALEIARPNVPAKYERLMDAERPERRRPASRLVDVPSARARQAGAINLLPSGDLRHRAANVGATRSGCTTQGPSSSSGGAVLATS
jgi:uncharacterized protein (DUF433 family)